MKRIALTDSETKATRVFKNPPWQLGSIISIFGGTFEVRMIHESGTELTFKVKAEEASLISRFKDW